MLDIYYLVAAAAPAFLGEAVVLILAGALIAYVCSRLGLVPIVGFLATGVLIGPHALGLVENRRLIDEAAELGVILLLFTIGLEFSLEKLGRIKKLIFGGGGLQVGLATLGTAVLLRAFGVAWPVGIFTGFLLALSSTAIVLKLIADRGETREEHGRVGVGLLIFQDLAIIAMVLLVPALAGEGGSALDVVLALGKAGAIVAVILLVARRLMPPILEKVALTCSPEIFLLSVIAICLGTAYLVSLAGISVSLGAFLAGLMVSESRFSHHAFAEILPLQILFSATFFVSVGMLLDLEFLVRNGPLVLAAVAAVLGIKILTTGVSVLALGYRLPVAASSALMLAQVGEFSFVLERTGRDMGLFPAGMAEIGSQTFIATTVVLMVLTPALARLGTAWAAKLETRHETREQAAMEATMEAEHPEDWSHLEGHVVLAGYAQGARRLARAFKEQEIPFLITTLSPGGANEVESLGMPVLRGDASKSQILKLAGIERARALVIADDEPAMAHRIAAVARSLNAELRIVIRTRSPADVVALSEAGADEVVTEELESTLQVCSDILALYGLESGEIASHSEMVRELARRGELDRPRDGSDLEATPAAPPRQDGAAGIDTECRVVLRPPEGAACSHATRVREVVPGSRGCEECLARGDGWVHLRVCMTCGHVGCCDSSKNKHATAHFHATDHPIVRSLEPGETWGWCYVDEVML